MISLFVFFTGGVTPSFGECEKSGLETKENYRKEVQTQRQNSKEKKRLINHALAVSSAVSSAVKLYPPKCIPKWTPSYLLYNGGNVIYGLGDMRLILSYRKESKQILEVYKDQDIDAQIEVFDRAYEDQMEAYEAARRRAKLFDSMIWVRRAGVASALLEAIHGKIPGAGGPYLCSAGRRGIKSSVEGRFKFYAMGRNVKELAAKNLMSTLYSGVMKESLGEKTPEGRIFLYGAQEIVAREAVKDAEEVKDCMKARAEEYRKMAEALRTKDGEPGDGSSGDPGTREVKKEGGGETEGQDTSRGFTREDFAGCVKRGAAGLVSDPRCSCAQKGTCFRIPKPSWTKTKGTTPKEGGSFQIPQGLLATTGAARDFANSIFSGDPKGAKLAAGRLGQGATHLNRDIEALKKGINKKRAKEGKKPIDFDKESRKLARKLQKSMGKALDGAGIRSVDQFNNAIKKALGHDDETSAQKGDIAASAVPGGGGEIGGGASEGKSSSFGFMEGLDDGEGEQALQKEGFDMERYTTSGEEDVSSAQRDIFQVLTFRYQRTAYPILLEKK